MPKRRDTILIVDDERFNLNVLKDLLEPDYDILVAMNGEQTLKRTVSATPPDLILLDIMMPGMDGYQVIQRLKADNATKEIPVIFITAMREETDETKGLGMGAVDYIVKPIFPSIVQARIKTHLALKWSMARERTLNRTLSQLNDELVDKNGELLELNKRLRDMATIDGLTEIPNRRRFDEFLNQNWHNSIRNESQLSLILMDIDFFKPFNDHYGHAAGDDCLRKVAKALAQSMTRASDLIARYGGEEFVCVLPGTDAQGASIFGNKLREVVIGLGIPHDHSKVSSLVTISLGAATMVPSRNSSPGKLMESADQNLYKAKKQGRNRLVS